MTGNAGVRTAGTCDIGNNAAALTLGNTTTTGTINMGNATTTGAIAMGGAQTTGALSLGVSSARTSNITIGHASSTGDVNVNTGGDITLAATNYVQGSWTPILYDASLTDVATITVTNGAYIRQGNFVNLNMRISVTSKGTLTGTERVVVGNLPFDAAALDWRVAGTFFGNCFEGTTYHQITPMFHDGNIGATNAFSFYKLDPTTNAMAEIVWNDLALNKNMLVNISYIM